MTPLNVYCFSFNKREPIYVAAASYSSALDKLMSDPDLRPKSEEDILSISHSISHCVFI